MLTTSAMRGPRRQRRSNSSTAATSPATSASTRAVHPVAHPAGYAQRQRLLLHPGTEAHALHPSPQSPDALRSCRRSFGQCDEPGGECDVRGDRRRRAAASASSPHCSAWKVRPARRARGLPRASSRPSASASPSTRLPSAGTAMPSAASTSVPAHPPRGAARRCCRGAGGSERCRW